MSHRFGLIMFILYDIAGILGIVAALLFEPIAYLIDVKKHGKEYADEIRRRWR